MSTRKSRSAAVIAALACASHMLPSPARAVDGVIEINHVRALAGGVTPSDAPGYPVTLDVPGSYRLTGGLQPPSGADGVEVTASFVSIDLNGFSIAGTAVCSSGPAPTCSDHGGVGISAYAPSGTTVRNGTVRGMQVGLWLGENSLVEAVTAVGNTDVGVFARGYSKVEASRSDGNGASGIFVHHDSRVIGNVSHDNAVGIAAGPRCIVAGNNVHQNSTGILQGQGGMAERNVVGENTAEGISVYYPTAGFGPLRADGNMLTRNGTDLGAGVTSTGTNACTNGSC